MPIFDTQWKASNDGEYSVQTSNYLSSRPKSERSPLGQFITPKYLRDKLIAKLTLSAGMRVLDPGVGTGEFLKSCREYQEGLYLEGWDIDPLALQVARQLVPTATLKLQSALEQPWTEDFDLVIGNPPYFEITNLNPSLKSRYHRVIGGRPNIFSLFFAAGLGALRHGGHLAFVVPPSMNNGAFFAKLREYILSNGELEFLEIQENRTFFEGVQTAVQLIIIRKGGTSTNKTVNLGDLGNSPHRRIIFAENPKLLEAEFSNRSTLWHLGYEAQTGSLVWNQNKENLRSTAEEDTVPLLWAHNITDKLEVELNETHPKKLQFVKNKNPLEGPAIILNRITGSVGSGTLKCALVPKGMKFIGENHVNVIKIRTGVSQKVGWEELLYLLRNPGVNHRVKLLTGNTQLSCVELTNWIPLDTSISVPANQSGYEFPIQIKLLEVE